MEVTVFSITNQSIFFHCILVVTSSFRRPAHLSRIISIMVAGLLLVGLS